MSDRDYQPGAAAGAHLEADRNPPQLVLARTLEQPPEEVWRALTDPTLVREWAPFDIDRDLGSLGPATLTMVGDGDRESLETAVVHADRPELLEYSFGDDVLRWELVRVGSGTALTLRHTLSDRAWVSRAAAGWHICLDVAERALAGRPIGRIVADEARSFGWERLEAEYAQRFGVQSTGWPAASDEP